MTQPKEKKEKMTEQEVIKEFLKEINETYQKYGYQLVFSPAWKAQDNGSYSLVIQTSVGKLPKNE